MSQVPTALRYTPTHEWVKQEEGHYVIGITDHAQSMLGDLVYVELPEIDTDFEAGEECAVVESVKAAADIYCPIPGEIIEINEFAVDNPQLINEDPYGRGWLIKVKPHEADHSKLLDANEYIKLVASEAH